MLETKNIKIKNLLFTEIYCEWAGCLSFTAIKFCQSTSPYSFETEARDCWSEDTLSERGTPKKATLQWGREVNNHAIIIKEPCLIYVYMTAYIGTRTQRKYSSFLSMSLWQLE